MPSIYTPGYQQDQEDNYPLFWSRRTPDIFRTAINLPAICGVVLEKDEVELRIVGRPLDSHILADCEYLICSGLVMILAWRRVDKLIKLRCNGGIKQKKYEEKPRHISRQHRSILANVNHGERKNIKDYTPGNFFSFFPLSFALFALLLSPFLQDLFLILQSVDEQRKALPRVDVLSLV